MNYENLSNEELLKEVYLTQHTDRLLTLVCERLEMMMREAEDAASTEIDELNYTIGGYEDEIYDLKRRIEDLESQLTDDEEF
ncbi:hypothetical protein UFOVP48_27 [uncultured Caudovirales phage]|uniref:Uncharacterized protein n=1 Tax=uncultured Caudovirales phage TaxID=2100421 RepID=A0A6J5KQL9_9CAUD|nr:hypothetical protein UFOVP48_27 [uncultured Caudovirales phage]